MTARRQLFEATKRSCRERLLGGHNDVFVLGGYLIDGHSPTVSARISILSVNPGRGKDKKSVCQACR